MQVRRLLPALAGVSSALTLSPAFAAFTAPAAFTTAVADSTEAVGILAAALIGVAAASVVVLMVVKYVKKIRSAG